MKKAISMLLCICSMISLLSLTGCGNSADSADDNKDPNPTVTSGLADYSNVAKDNEDNAGEAVYGGSLKIGVTGLVSNPGYTAINGSNATITYMRTAYESLLVFDDTGALVPQLCESYVTDPDEPSITWKLKEGIQFADGTAFNAEAVKRNIEEYQICNRGEVASIAACEIVDEYTIKMVLDSWNSSAVESIGFFILYVSPKALENPDSLANSTCGTGPFQLSEFEPNLSAVYTKNENYWQEGKPYLDSVGLYFIGESTTMKNAFLAGEYDIIENSDVNIANELMTAYASDFESGKFIRQMNKTGQGVTSTGIIPCSTEPGTPWADARVRLAMAYAIDNQAIVDAFTYGNAVATDQWAVPGSATYNTGMENVSYNPEKARELLAAAGYPDGFDTTLNITKGVDMYSAVAAMLTAVGIRTEVNIVDSATWFSYMSGTWSGLTEHAATVSPDLGLYMGRHLSATASFYRKGIIEDEQSIELLNKICAAKTEEEKLALEMEMQELIYNGEDGLMLFGKVLYVQPQTVFKYGYVHNDNYNVCFNGACLNFADAWKEA